MEVLVVPVVPLHQGAPLGLAVLLVLAHQEVPLGHELLVDLEAPLDQAAHLFRGDQRSLALL